MLITPETKVAALLDQYPQLEDVLISMAPPFKKLRNPFLRRTVAKVASLRQAAAVGKLAVADLVNKLRAEVGQPPMTEAGEQADSYFGPRPEWAAADKVVESIDERETDQNVMPLNPLIRRASKMADGEILELVTTFLPAPGIDLMRNKGYLAWSMEDGELVKTYFAKEDGPPPPRPPMKRD
jgi:hypothetical protein